MFKNKAITCLTIVALLALLLIGIFLLVPVEQGVDEVEINSIIEECKESYLSELAYEESTLYDYTVIDLYENDIEKLYRHNGIGMQSVDYSNAIAQATSSNYVVRDIVIRGEIISKVIIDTKVLSNVNNNINILKWSFICLVGAIIGMLLIWYMYITFRVYAPFYKLDKFAEQVSRGNFDEPLDMDRNNSFGRFQESFDIMRINVKVAREAERSAEVEKKLVITELSHDLKMPIASIIAMSECMSLDGEDKWSEKIIIKANQINRIINDMYSSTLDDIGELKVVAIPHSSNDILQKIIESDYLGKVTIGIMPEVQVKFDEFRLKQVIDNIIFNSYKYADTKIDATFSESDEYLSIAIKDYGNGVAEGEIDMVTERFYRAKNNNTIQGEGLGLFIAKTLMEKQDGSIDISSKDGFCVLINLKKC